MGPGGVAAKMNPKHNLKDRTILVYLPRRASSGRLPLQLRAAGVRKLVEINRLSQLDEKTAGRVFDLILIAHFGPAPETVELIDRIMTGRMTAGGDEPGPPIAAITESDDVDHILKIMALGVHQVVVDSLPSDQLAAALGRLIDPESARPPGSELVELGWRCFHEGDTDRARQQFKDLIFDPNLGFDARLGLFEIDSSARDWSSAEGQLDRAEEAANRIGDPVQRRLRAARVQFLRGRLHLARGAAEEAEACHRRALELNPYGASDLAALVDLLDLTGRQEEIPALIAAAGETFPPYAPGLAVLADGVDKVCRRLRRQGDAGGVGRLYTALARLPHGNDRVHCRMVDYLIEAGLAHLALSGLIAAEPRIKDPSLLARLGRELLAPALVVSVRRLHFKDPPDPGGSRPVRPVGQTDQALDLAGRVFERASRLEPDNPDHRIYLAACLVRRGLLDRAAKEIGRLAGDRVADPDLTGRIIEAAERVGASGLVDFWLDRPENDRPDHLEKALLSARRLLGAGRAAEAATVLRKALAASPGDRELLTVMAEANRALGRND